MTGMKVSKLFRNIFYVTFFEGQMGVKMIKFGGQISGVKYLGVIYLRVIFMGVNFWNHILKAKFLTDNFCASSLVKFLISVKFCRLNLCGPKYELNCWDQGCKRDAIFRDGTCLDSKIYFCAGRDRDANQKKINGTGQSRPVYIPGWDSIFCVSNS